MNKEIFLIWIKRNKQVIPLIAAGLLVCGFIFLRILPSHIRSKFLEQKRMDQEIFINNSYSAIGEMPKLQEKLKDLREQLYDYNLKIPEQADIGQFLAQIASLMDRHRLTEQMIEPQKEIRTEQFNCIAVTMKCRGKLDNIRQYFQSLQKLDRAIRIEKFKLSNDRDLTGLVTMETEAVIYYRSSRS